MCVRLVRVGHTDDDTLSHSKWLQTFEPTCCRAKNPHCASDAPELIAPSVVLCAGLGRCTHQCAEAGSEKA